jgi:uncharacterized protein (TIGR03382 family)
MKVKALGLLAGAVIATGANADFTGLSAVAVDLNTAWADAGIAVSPAQDTTGLIVWHVFANFDGLGTDNAILGIGAATVSTDTAFVDYDGLGGNTEGLPSTSLGFITGGFGQIAVDCFWTINQLAADGTLGGASSGVGGTPVPDFANGGNLYVNTDAGYGVTPVSGFGDAVNGQVLIAQIVTQAPAGDGTPTGGIELSVELSTSETTVDGFVSTIPAPGALALLGLAGVASRRRRR